MQEAESYFGQLAIRAREELGKREEMRDRLNGNGHKPKTLQEEIAAAHGLRLNQDNGNGNGRNCRVKHETKFKKIKKSKHRRHKK